MARNEARVLGLMVGLLAAALGACSREAEQTESADSARPELRAQPGTDSVTAVARLASAEGQPVGEARLRQESAGVWTVEVQASSLPAGAHGIHIHTTGSCAPRNDTAFAAAGAHFNPETKQHGLENPQGPHAGDLANLDVAADGSATATLTLAGAALGSGTSALLDADGAAVVIHEQADDQRTDPSGNSGARIACGVLEPA